MYNTNNISKAITGSEMPCKTNNKRCNKITVSNEDSPCMDDFGYNNWYADGCIKAERILDKSDE